MILLRPTFYRLYNRLLLGLLTLLGFGLAGCENTEEYGTPYATYEFKGSVRNAAGRPIEGIQVECRPSFLPAFQARPLARTDAGGKFAGQLQDMPDDEWIVRFTDIDGPENGSYATDSVEVVFEKKEYKKGKGSWNRGFARKELPAVVLKEKP